MSETPTLAPVEAPKPLGRSMKLLGGLFLALSAATPASSVFVIVPDVIAQAGTGALISMIAAAFIALSVGQVYAETSSAFPLAGGEYAIVGRTLGLLPGFAILGLNLLNSLLAVAVLSLGIGEYLGPLAGGLSARTVALIAIAGATLLGVLNIRTNALVTGLFVLVELIALAVLAALGFGHAVRSPLEMLAHPVTLQAGALAPVGLTAIGMSVAVAIFAYDGYGAAVYFGEEMHAAPRRIGRAIVFAVLITVAAEIVPLTAVLMGAPDLKALLGSKSVIGDFTMATGGPVLQRALSLGVALAILNAVIATVLLVSRQLYSTGRDRIWPARMNTALVQVHPKLESPWAATLVSGALACGLCFIDLHQLLTLSGAGVVFVYALMCLAAIQGRRTGTSAHGLHRMPLFPWAPILTLVALAGVAWTAWADPEEGRVGLIASLATGVLFALYYLMFIRPRGDWRLQGPQETEDTFG